MSNLVVTIMAAGEGKRMRSPLPKVLNLFKKRPMLVRIVQTTMALQPKKIIIITGKHHDLIKTTLAEYIDISKLLFVQQVEPLGTGDAIRYCLPHYEVGEKVLILNGDMPLINIETLTRFINKSKRNNFTVLVARYENPFGYGRIIYQYNSFSGIVEEKDCTEAQRKIEIINSGIYFVDAVILKKYIPWIDNNNAQKEFYLTDLVKIVYNHTDIPMDTYLIDELSNRCISGVNTPEELAILESAL
jgi:bifunctional UDP-N-acetylglucosamine pyrophosphorylase/glucosamine-1-phosphate N-acetyltransferase